jgi:hypothetical protein
MSECSSGSCAGSKCPGKMIGVVFIAIAIAFSGWAVKSGLESFRMADRSVAVKGLAERDAEADLAVWGLSYGATGNDIGEVQKQIESYNTIINAYLTEKKFSKDEIEYLPLQSQDLLAQAYRPDNVAQGRYIVTQNINLRTTDMNKMGAAMADIGSLLKQGMTLNNAMSPVYMFTKLNEVKTDMLAEAIKNARKSAEEFARDSGQSIGAIKGASQGTFQILPRDPNDSVAEQNQRYKKIRVVSTIEYYLN